MHDTTRQYAAGQSGASQSLAKLGAFFFFVAVLGATTACASQGTTAGGSTTGDAGGGSHAPVTLPLDSHVVEGAYTLQLSVGTPAQSFDVVVDTGSANLILLGDASLCDNCANLPNQSTYAPKKSSSAQLSDTSFTARYGSGSLEAREVSDKVTLGSLPPLDTTFAVMTHQAHIQNILGMAYKVVARPENRPLEPFFDTLAPANGLADSFSMRMCEGKGSQMTFGASADGMDHFVPITEEKWYVISPKKFLVGGKSLGKVRIPTVVDSGTTNLNVPTAMHQKIMNTLAPVAEQHKLNLADEFVATTPEVIAEFPTIQIQIKDTDGQMITLDIPPQNYFKPAGPAGFLFHIGINDQELLLGQVFMKGYTVLFDRAGKRLGFGPNTGCQ